MGKFEWDWPIRIGFVLGIAGLYYQVFYGFFNDFKNFPNYFWPLLSSVIFSIIVTFLLENCRWNNKEIPQTSNAKGEPPEPQSPEIRLLTEIRDILLKGNEESSKTNTLIIDFSLLALIIAIVALTISYFQSLSAIEFVISQSVNQTMFPVPIQDQIKYFNGVFGLQFGIAFLAIMLIVIGVYRIKMAIKK